MRLEKLKTKILPPIVFGTTALMMLLMTMLTREIEVNETRFAVALLIGFIGLAFATLAIKQFREQHTTIDARHPEQASTLITTGIYRITRNPMYLAMFFVLIAWGLILGTYICQILPFAYAAYIHCFQILPEETVLTEKFGHRYSAYKSQVARWLIF